MKKINSIFIFLVILLITISCTNENSITDPAKPDKTGSEWKGIGKSQEAPEGKSFSLPSGIKLAGEIKNYDEDECGCRGRNPNCLRGTGENVRVCMGFTNSTSNPIKVTIPQGLILISNDIKIQNGLVIEVVTFEIPAFQTMYFSLGAYCLNEVRRVPKFESTFELGPVTRNELLHELMKFVDTKHISDYSDSGMVQGAIWSITEDKDLGDLFRGKIAAFPDK